MPDKRQKGHRWRPIEELPPDWRATRFAELGALHEVWQRQRKDLEGAAVLQEFQARMVRSWSIETGILEQLYSLGDSVTLTLVEQGFDAALISHGDTDLPPAQLISILEDHREVAEGLFTFVKGARQLSTSYVRELHQVLTRHQLTSDALDSQGNLVKVPLRRGDYKTMPNNPGDARTGEVWHQYCPPEQVASEMDRLVAMHLGHGEVPFVLEAAWLHHRFTQIHPFQDGNGRVARALATLVCLRAGGFPLVVRGRQKREYIGALEAADQGDLRPLTGLFERQQRDALVGAISLAHQVIDQHATIEAIVADAKRRLDEVLVQGGTALRARAAELQLAAQRNLQGIAATLNASLGPRVQAAVFQSKEDDSHWFRAQTLQTAKELGYYANLSGPKHWVHLRLRHEDVSSLVVSFHHIGRVEDGVMAAAAFLGRREAPRAKAADAADEGLPFASQVVCDSPFSFTAGREAKELHAAFAVWLDRAITVGLDQWRRWL